MKPVLFCAIALLGTLVLPAQAQEARPYKEGAVLEVTEVRTLDGQFDNYMQHLHGDYRKSMEAQKKAGIILDYGIYARQPRTPEEGNLYLTVVYPSMAALDGLRDRVDPLMKETIGQDSKQASQAYADRGSMRRILGSELIRELELTK